MPGYEAFEGLPGGPTHLQHAREDGEVKDAGEVAALDGLVVHVPNERHPRGNVLRERGQGEGQVRGRERERGQGERGQGFGSGAGGRERGRQRARG